MKLLLFAYNHGFSTFEGTWKNKSDNEPSFTVSFEEAFIVYNFAMAY